MRLGGEDRRREQALGGDYGRDAHFMAVCDLGRVDNLGC
jgi:hypothetical protein